MHTLVSLFVWFIYQVSDKKLLANSSNLRKIVNLFGMWRSLVAHLSGGQGVAGSSPVIPTINQSRLERYNRSSLYF